MDEHLIYTDLPNGKIKILPADGYEMVHILRQVVVSEAIVTTREVKYFVSREVVE